MQEKFDENLIDSLTKDAEKFLIDLTTNSKDLKFKDSKPVLNAIMALGAWLNEAVCSIQFAMNEKNADLNIVKNRIECYSHQKKIVEKVIHEVLKRIS